MKRIFISSTFADMQAERDLLCTKVASKLNEQLFEFGEYVSFSDLRWGVNTSELESDKVMEKVLNVCLDEIDRCDKTGSLPYIIVLIGNRYGFTPNEKEINDAVGVRKKFKLNENVCSVTALEIEYGALRDRQHLERTLFYFREIDNLTKSDNPLEPESVFEEKGKTLEEIEAKQKALGDLKIRIQNAGGNVYTYHTRLSEDKKSVIGLEDSEGFYEQVLSDLENLMKKDRTLSSSLSPSERIGRAQWNIAMQKAEQFGARQDVADSILLMLARDPAPVALVGKTGSGKSTLISRMAEMLREDHRDVVPIFCGSSISLNDALDVLAYIVYQLEERLQLPHIRDNAEDLPTLADLRERLAFLVKSYDQEDVVMLIDGVDQLFSEESRENLVFLPTTENAKVKFVFSCTDDFTWNQKAVNNVRTHLLDDLKENEVHTAIDGILKYHGRELETVVRDVIVKKESARNPLYLSLLVRRLLMMDQFDYNAMTEIGDNDQARAAYKMELIDLCADTVEELCYDIINEAAKRIGIDWAQDALEYIALSQSGLRETDLDNLMAGTQWNSLDFTMLCHYLNGFFLTRDDGRIDFTHKTIRRGIVNACENAKQKHMNIRLHLHSLSWNDPVSLDETVYQCCKADDKEYFVWYIEDIVKDDYEIAITPSSKTLFNLINHEDSWFTQILRNTDDIALTRHFYAFIYKHLYNHFLTSGQSVKTITQIMYTAIKRFSAECDFSDPQNRQVAAEFNYCLGKCFAATCDYVSSEMFLKESIRVCELIPNRSDACEDLLESACNQYGIVLGEMGRQEESLHCYKRCVEIRKKLGGNTWVLSLYYHNIADYYWNIGDYEKAAVNQEQALVMAEAYATVKANDYAKTMILYYRKYATICCMLNRTGKAKEYIEKAFSLAQREAAKNPEKYEEVLGYVYNDKGFVLAGEIYNEQAVDCYRKAVDIFTKYANLFTEKYEEVLATCLCNLAGEYEKSESNIALSEEAYREGISIRERLFAVNAPGTALALFTSYNNLGVLYTKQGRWGDARHCFLRAIATADKCPLAELYGHRDRLRMVYMNTALTFHELFMPIKARRYRETADMIEKCEDYAAFSQLYANKLKKNGNPRILKRDNASHLLLKVNLLYSVYYLSELIGMEVEKLTTANVREAFYQFALIHILGWVFGFLASLVLIKEGKPTQKEKNKLFILCLVSPLVSGWYALTKFYGYRKQRKKGLRPDTVKRGTYNDFATADAEKLQKEIERLEKENLRLEKGVQMVKSEEYRKKRKRMLNIGIILGIGTVGLYLSLLDGILSHIEFMKTWTGPAEYLDYASRGSSAYAIGSALFWPLLAANVYFAFQNVKNVWLLDVKKRTALIVLSVISLGVLSGVSSYALFRKETNVKLDSLFTKVLLVFYAPILIPFLLLSKTKNTETDAQRKFDNVMERKIYLNTERINHLQLLLAKTRYDR